MAHTAWASHAPQFCTLLAAGIFGLLRLAKWGWALVTAGCLLFAAGDFYYFSHTHVGFFLVRGLFVLVFFLYLVRAGGVHALHARSFFKVKHRRGVADREARENLFGGTIGSCPG